LKRDDFHLWLNAALDGELDIGKSLEMHAQLARDPALKATWDRQQALRTAIREGAVYHPAPDGLRRKLTDTLGQKVPGTGPLARAEPSKLHVNQERRRWGLALASALASALLTWGITWNLSGVGASHRTALERIAEDAVAAHVRALMADRLIDVASSDQHAVKPWLTAHLSYAPPVPDLSAQGFELVGARRDVIDGQTAATLVYRRRQHVISAFIRPVGAQSDMKVLSVRGFNVIRIARNNMEYWVVSDLNARELGDFVELVQEGK
jgi:anti-sigma factor RsiW